MTNEIRSLRPVPSPRPVPHTKLIVVSEESAPAFESAFSTITKTLARVGQKPHTVTFPNIPFTAYLLVESTEDS